MTKRSYRQFCAISRALDAVGERWTLLLVRELLAGPRRYTDLLAGLPGIGTNLLAARLRELEDGGVVERTTLPPPAGSVVYSLTARGKKLESVVLGLGAWGMELADAPAKGDTTRPWWSLLLLNGRFDATALAGVEETYEIHAGDEVFHLDVGPAGLAMAQGAARQPVVTLKSDADTLASIVAGKTTFAAAANHAHVSGDAKAVRRFERIFQRKPARSRDR